jgi:hypothetical protein
VIFDLRCSDGVIFDFRCSDGVIFDLGCSDGVIFDLRCSDGVKFVVLHIVNTDRIQKQAIIAFINLSPCSS